MLQECAAAAELVAHAGLPQGLPAATRCGHPHPGVLAGAGRPARLRRAAHLPLRRPHPADRLARLQSPSRLPACGLLCPVHPDGVAASAGDLPALPLSQRRKQTLESKTQQMLLGYKQLTKAC